MYKSYLVFEKRTKVVKNKIIITNSDGGRVYLIDINSIVAIEFKATLGEYNGFIGFSSEDGFQNYYFEVYNTILEPAGYREEIIS